MGCYCQNYFSCTAHIAAITIIISLAVVACLGPTQLLRNTRALSNPRVTPVAQFNQPEVFKAYNQRIRRSLLP